MNRALVLATGLGLAGAAALWAAVPAGRAPARRSLVPADATVAAPAPPIAVARPARGRAADDGPPPVERRAAVAGGESSSPPQGARAARALAPRLSADTPAQAEVATRALARELGPTARAELAALLDDASAGDAERLAAAALLRAGEDVEPGALRAHAGPEAAARLRAALARDAGGDPARAASAARSLARLGGATDRLHLVELLAGDDVPARRAAARGLADARDPDVVGPLAALLGPDRPPGTQARALTALAAVAESGEARRPGSPLGSALAAELARAADDRARPAADRRRAMIALGGLAAAVDEDRLRWIAAFEDADAGRAAVDALARAGESGRARLLDLVLADGVGAQVQVHAAARLAGTPDALSTERTAAEERLRAALASDSTALRRTARRALGPGAAPR